MRLPVASLLVSNKVAVRYGFPYFTRTAVSRYTKGMKVQNEANMTKPTISNIEPGRVYKAGYIRGDRNFTDYNRFVGFKVGELFFTNLKQLKAHFGVRNLKELEFETERLELGSVTAEWFSTEEGYFWGAYLYAGAFRVGTSADRLTLAAA